MTPSPFARGPLAGLLAIALLTGACRKADSQSEAPDATTAPLQSSDSASGKKPLLLAQNSPPAKPTAPRANTPPPAEIWKEFSGERAFAEVKKQVEIGPRPSGSKEVEKARSVIADSLAQYGWEVERQEFTDTTPRGAVKFVNLIARFSPSGAKPAPTSTQRAIVCSHYDTKRFSTIQFVGASDGASSTGALVELARVLAMNPALAAKVELAFFDGEEAVVQFTETDGLYGSRHYASSLRESGRAAQFQFGILWDMIGDKDLTITLSPDSPQPLTKQILDAAETLGLRKHFGYYDRSIWDDHVPLNTAKIPTIDLIDFDYLPWHTSGDTLDKLSPESLQKIGSVTLLHLSRGLGK